MYKPEVIYPNFRRVQSGVSTTVFRLAQKFHSRGDVNVKIAGYCDLESCEPISLAALMSQMARCRQPVIWHARRNIEMLAGIALRRLGFDLKLVFTSAAQRRHTSYTRWLMRQMDRIIYTSRRSASFVPLEGPVVGHGVDLPLRVDRAVLKTTIGLDPSRFYVASFGTVRPSKGTDLLVDALIRLLPSRPRWCALIVGPTDSRHKAFRDDLMARVERSGLGSRIVFTGYLEDASLHLQAVDLCVAPSRQEGFGLTAIEAMAAGIPVIASGAGSYPEMVLDEVTGHLVETGNVEHLTATIARLMDDDQRREAMGSAARQHVAQRWTIDSEADALAGIYRDLLNPGAVVQRPLERSATGSSR